MTSKLTSERIEWLNYAATGLAANGTEMAMSPQDVIALTECCLAAMDSEPVAEVVSIYGDPEAFGEREIKPLVGIQQMPYGTKLYRHAQPAPELTATVERLNTSGYEYEGREVTPQNVAAVVDILLQQLDDATRCQDVDPIRGKRPEKY